MKNSKLYTLKVSDIESVVGNIEVKGNTLLVGGPGTGKTTFARSQSSFYDNYVEVGRSELVGEYLGHSSLKVNKVFDEAEGGLLFIDDAFDIMRNKNDVFGEEAIKTIIEKSKKADVVVLFAGYEKEMSESFNLSSDLSKLCSGKIIFNDFSLEKLTNYIKAIVEQEGESFENLFIDSFKERLYEAYDNGDTKNGNARWAKQFAQEMIEEQLIKKFSNRG